MELKILNADQTERLVSLLEDQIETYGFKTISRIFRSRRESQADVRANLDFTMYGELPLSNFIASDICRILGVDPNYVLKGKNSIYSN